MKAKWQSLNSESILNVLFYLKKPVRIFALAGIFCLLVAASYFRDIVFFTRDSSVQIPAQITFNFDLDGISSDHVYVKRHAQDEEGIEVDQSLKTVSTTYNYPGYFKARLLVENQIVKTSDVFIKTNGWLATVPTSTGINYFNQEDITSNNTISIPKKWTKRKEVKRVTYHYFDQINPISGLDFILEADLKTNQNELYDCDLAKVEIIGSNSSTIIPISLSACSLSDPLIIAGHEYFTKSTMGKFLSANSVAEWEKLKLIVHGGVAKFLINGKEQLQLPVRSSMGQIVGLRFHFEGNGSIKNVNLTDTQEVTYVDAFVP